MPVRTGVARRADMIIVDVDACLWTLRGPHAEARLRVGENLRLPAAEEADHRHRRLLRARRERPPHRRTAEQRDELPAFHHSITSSAIASSVLGTVRPSA